MKNIKQNIIAAAALLCSVSFFPSCSTPADYCETMVMLCTDIEADLNDLSEEIKNKDYEAAEEVYSKNLENINKTIQKINVKGGYKEDTQLFDAALQFANTYKDIYQNEYRTCIDILKKENHTYADGDSLAFMMDGLSQKYLTARKELVNAYKAFMAANDLIEASY